jgi:hypothetical protein
VFYKAIPIVLNGHQQRQWHAHGHKALLAYISEVHKVPLMATKAKAKLPSAAAGPFIVSSSLLILQWNSFSHSIPFSLALFICLLPCPTSTACCICGKRSRESRVNEPRRGNKKGQFSFFFFFQFSNTFFNSSQHTTINCSRRQQTAGGSGPIPFLSFGMA